MIRRRIDVVKTRLLSSLLRRVALREWFSILMVMLLLALGLGWQNGLGRLDQTLYDKFVSANGREARSDIVIVAIDDFSLAQLGSWPWPRKLHAQLIEKISQGKPRLVGLDVVLSEPEPAQADGSRPGDLALQRTLRESRRTVLPIVTANAGPGLKAALPLPEFADAARALGHVSLDHDGDGVVRSVFLHEAQGGKWWPHFALALLDPDGWRNKSTPTDASRVPLGWRHAGQMHIPFVGNGGHFSSVPYVSVLQGEVPDQFFEGKYVLIGATARGMNDAYPTPVSGESGAMDGIEIHANILAALLDEQSIAIAYPWQTAWFSAAPVLIAMLCYLLLSPRMSLLVTGALLVSIVAVSYLALSAGLWLAPSAGLIALIVSYPLWSWRRLEAAIAYLSQEFTRLDQEPHLLPESPQELSDEQIEDVLERRINAVKDASRRVRDLRQFVSDILDNLPYATLVTTTAGHVLLSNRQAKEYFTSIGIQELSGASLPNLFVGMSEPQTIGLASRARFDWGELIDPKRAAALAGGVGVHDQHGRDLLVKSAPCHATSNGLSGWIVSVIDISTVRSAERSRDDTLRFLSHDMRAPQASILALLELQGNSISALPQAEFFARVEKASRKTLGLADNFVQLARAESQAYRMEEVDFQDILFDASDEMWTLAKSKDIKLVMEIADMEFPAYVDRSLMTRAVVNILSNAINYSPEHTRVTCLLRKQYPPFSSHIVCSISDQGYGIEADEQYKLFQRFQYMEHARQTRHEGIGLGLVFVKTVIERHHGQITFTSKVGEGTTFTLDIPAYRP